MRRVALGPRAASPAIDREDDPHENEGQNDDVVTREHAEKDERRVGRRHQRSQGVGARR